MSPELNSCLVQLKNCLDTQQVPRARSIIVRLTQLIVETTTESQTEAEYNLECIFDTPNGLIAFLQRSFSGAKLLAKVNEDVFELFRKTIAKHSTLLRKWMTPIVSIALRFIQSSSVTARERELATLILQDSIAYGCLQRDSYERIDQLLDELLQVFQQRKLTNRFQQNLFELLGQLTKNFPECVTEPDRLRDAFLSAAESQLLEENYPSLVSLAGAIRGLDLFLFHFAPTEDEEELRKRLYVLAKKLSICDEGRSERAVFRNALQLLADHAPLFTVYLYEDHIHWQTVLVGRWIKSANRDDRHVALSALYAFHGEVARVLSRPEIITASQRECPRPVEVLNQYLAYYRKLLNAASTDRLEMRIAIRGFGIMAGPCRKVTGSSVSLNELLTIVLDRIEGICGRPSAGDMLEYLPDFMRALSEILNHALELSTVQIVSVQTMLNALIRDFYHVPAAHHETVVQSLLCTLANVGQLGGSALDQMLDNVLLQGVIWSCTHSLPYDQPAVTARTAGTAYGEATSPYDWKQELVTYKNYLPLWQGLLETQRKNVDENSDDDGTLTRAIYRAFMRTLFGIVEKLDLSTRKRTFRDEGGMQRELFFCDPNIDRIPNKPKDFHIFLNLVELYRDVLHGPRASAAIRKMYLEWIHRYFDQFVKLSLRHPLVSGFVKLIEMGLGTAETIGYFSRDTDERDSRSTVMLLVYYLECTIRKALQATGELQLACLRFVLNAPVRLLLDFIDDQAHTPSPMVAVFQVTFRLGRGLLSIARTGLACLQRIVRFGDPPVRPDQRETVLRHVLPMLEPYLQARDSTQPAPASLRLAKFKRERTANVTPGRIERIKQQHRIEQATEMSELVAFQLRVLHFLGDLQPNECCWMVADEWHNSSGSPVEQKTSLTRWDADSKQSIELRLLCASGTRPCIKLDNVIGRVCLLAVECSDRATKLAACELLHTIVLYLLGIHYQDQLHGLWSQLCHHLLQLSCDTDLAVCQMFEPLVFQIIHYLTQPSKLNQQGTSALVDCLMNATSNEQNGAIRDLAVRGLREFLQWTNRQSGSSQSLDDRMKVKRTVLELLKTSALESDASRRYGSALAFNNVFRLLAQDDAHVVRYWFELTHAFAVGFIVSEEHQGAMSSEASVSGSDLGQFELALEHAAKVIEQRRVLFNGDCTEPSLRDVHRIVPPAIGGGELRHLVGWLFGQCATRQRTYRRKCMQLFQRLAPVVRDVANGAEFLQKHLTPDQVYAVCLQSGFAQGLDRAPKLQDLEKSPSEYSQISDIYLWLEYLLATLDIVGWLLRENLLPEDLFRSLLARVFPAVRYFLQSLVNASMHELLALLDPDGTVDTQTGSEDLRMSAEKMVRFDGLKMAIVIQIVRVLTILLENGTQRDNLLEFVDELVDDRTTIEFLFLLLFEPRQCTVFDHQELEADRLLWNQLETLFRQLANRRVSFAQALSVKTITLVEGLTGRLKMLLLQRTIGQNDQKIAKGLLFVAKLLQQERTIVLKPERVCNASSQLLDVCSETITNDGVKIVLTPSAARFGTSVLQALFGLSRIDDRVDERLLRRVVECSLNCIKLQSNIRHGQHFVACFGPAIFGLFLTDAIACMNALMGMLVVDNFVAVVKFLCELMEYVYRTHREDREERLRTLTEVLLRGWDRIYECSRVQENRFNTCDLQLIELMTNVAMVCPFPLHEIRCKTSESYGRWLIELIGTAGNSIALKSKAIVLLPTLLGTETGDAATNGRLEDALEALQTTHFPLRSTELPPNSPQRTGFVNCLERLLDALVVSRAPLLLRSIIQMTAPDGEGNVAERQIRSSVERFFDGQRSAAQCERLQEMWELFMNHAYAPSVRATVLRRYLCTGLWRCSYDTITAFYRRNIRAISELANAELANGRTGWDLEHALVDRSAAFRLVEQYAALLPKAVLLADDCTVAGKLYESGGSATVVRGQRLIGDFSKRAYNARTVPFRADDRKTAELFRQYQCAAFRALVALISNTNDNARMYSVLIFRETRDKGEFLWRLLIDCSNEHLYLESSQELDEAPRTIEKRVAIRREGDTALPSPDKYRSEPGHAVVAESSLSQQVSRFDLNHSVMLSAREVALRDAEELSKRQRGIRSNVPLERTKINEHEVMATVCGCIRHLAAAGITTEPVVRFLVDSLVDPSQPKNVRLFLAKVIDNCRRELASSAPLLLAPLMQLIVDGQIFRALNTLVTDLIALVLEWSSKRSTAQPLASSGGVDECASLASALLRFLMKHSHQQLESGGMRQSVFRLNLDLIRTLIKQWQDVITVPTELLFVLITAWDGSSAQASERSQFQLTVGLQLGTIVLLNGGARLVPWMESTRDDYLRAVMNSLDAPNSTIFKPAAQLLGLCLARLYPGGVPEDLQPSDDTEASPLVECIARLSNINRDQKRKFFEILYEISRAFPSIVDPFLSVVSFRIPTGSVAEKRMGLELLLGGRIERFHDELYRELASLDLGPLMRDPELQLATLHLINRALPLVGELRDLQQWIDPVGTVATQRTTTPSACRAVAYEILIYIHEKRATELPDDRRQTVWRYLLSGLCETSETDTGEKGHGAVRTRVLEYLTDSGKLPVDVRERFIYLLTELYDPSVEADFLGTAVGLLLDPAIRCRESKDRLFLHEYLSADVKFREYTIETGARKRHSLTVLTPLFAETATQRQLQAYLTGRGSQMEQMIRATQFSGEPSMAADGQFEPTQDPTQFTRATATFALPTQHSLPFEAGSLQLDRRSQRTGPGSGREETTDPDPERTFERLRKRILKDSEANRQRQTSWAVGRHYSAQRMRTEARREGGASQVALYRRYRLADYPDLQINLLAFLLPLQALCRRDAPCARQTFVALFNGLVEGLTGEGSTPGEWNQFLGCLDRSLQRILESTKAYDPNLFGALIELTLGKASGRLTLCPRTVASVAGGSNLLTMGVLYVEGKLTDGAEFAEQSIRSGQRGASSEAEHWLQLSTLYHTLREHDTVADIFGSKLDSDPRLRDAIELEALGWYDRAYRAYSELIGEISPARTEERNFCYKSAYECLLRLGQWEVLLEEIGGQVSSHDELWTDEWNQENLLPSYMHGNVRLNLAGDPRGQEFCRFLDDWMHIPSRAEHIRQHFGEELTALQLASGELVRARLFAEQTERQFLDEWHCAGVLSEVFRIECLLGVRKVIELRAYAELLEEGRSVRPGSNSQAIVRLGRAWSNARPNVTDSLISWDTIVAHRRFLLAQLERQTAGAAEDGGTLGHLSQLSELLFELELHLLEVAFEQRNVVYAGKMILRLRADETSEAADRPINPEQLLRRRIARLRYDRVRMMRASTNDPAQLLKGFRRLAHLTTQTMQSRSGELRLPKALGSAWAELFHFSECFRRGSGHKDAQNIDEVLAIIRSTVGNDTIDGGKQEGADANLQQFSLHCLQRSIEEIGGGGRGNETFSLELADAYFRLAQYCYGQLNNTERLDCSLELSLERQLVGSLLPAIQHGSREARQFFPVLLQLRNLQNGVLRSDFELLSRAVPSWNFLPWIPQLLSYLKLAATDVPAGGGSFLDELLLRLATDYPMALYFPAGITLEQHRTTEAPERRPFVGRFRAALGHATMNRFVEELCRVVMPEMCFLALVAALRKRLKCRAEQPHTTWYRPFIQSVTEKGFTVDANDSRCGKAYRALCPQVHQWLSLANLDPVTERAVIEERLQQLEGALKAFRPRAQQHRVQLEDLSPWLAGYHYGAGARWGETIELPGQYEARDGRRPNVANHVRLAKIVPDLIVYGTLRMPALITFRGSDGRQYRFLAKHGEDLRQDQRIQQLQQEITHRLRMDRRCTEQRLELRTYQVIPIRPDFGMLGWLEGTVSMQHIAVQADPRYNPSNVHRGQMYVREQYARFLLGASKQTLPNADEMSAISMLSSPALYGMAAYHSNPTRLRLKYLELSQTIRGDTLKRALFDMASSPEAFYRLRMNFGRSLAVMNITCWVLGIGDRHLSNIVLEQATGKLVGVDFGIAFGAGTCNLPVPELIPFRLTPQFVGVMEPMRLSGVLHKCHLYTLQCLRDARKLLCACLEVFIREPTVDWLEAARQRHASGESTAANSSIRHSTGASVPTWEPKMRVDTVMRKLNGANPKRLLMEELQHGLIACQPNFLNGYLVLVQAAAELSTKLVTETENQEQLTTELQVAMLLEMATDEKLLGIAYHGWYPWF